MSRAKELRKRIRETDSPLKKHSLSGPNLKYGTQGEIRLAGTGKDKASKAERRRNQEADIEERIIFQFQRSATRIERGFGTQVDRDYIRKGGSIYGLELSLNGDSLEVIGGYREQEFQETSSRMPFAVAEYILDDVIQKAVNIVDDSKDSRTIA